MTKTDGWGSEWPVVKCEEKEYIVIYGKEVHPDFDKAADAAMNKASGVPEQWIAEASHDKTPWPITNMAEEALKQDSGVTPEMLGVKPVNLGWPKSPTLTGLDMGIGEQTILTTFENDGIKHHIISQTELKSQGSNLVDDQAYLYFQCESCNEILDPHTKSFAKLQEHRINAGWKCIWNMNGQGYKVYCEKCEEKV